MVAIASLATLAKNGQYYPQSNPARQVSIATKINVDHSPVNVVVDHLVPVTRFFSLEVLVRVFRVQWAGAPSKLRIGVTVSRQLRSPPSSLS